MAGKGGYRERAGRPKGSKQSPVKKLLKAVYIDKPSAALILSQIDEGAKWKSLLNCKDLRIELDCLKYLTDRRDGKAEQYVKTEVINGDPDKRLRELLAKRGGKSASKADPEREDGADFPAGIGRA